MTNLEEFSAIRLAELEKVPDLTIGSGQKSIGVTRDQLFLPFALILDGF
jgi:hypothetical protein